MLMVHHLFLDLKDKGTAIIFIKATISIIVKSSFDLRFDMNFVAADCEVILEKVLQSRNFGLVDFEIQKIGNFLGFLGEHHQIQINFKNHGKFERFSFFVKSLPIANKLQRQTQSEQGFHLKEVKIYQDIFPKLSGARTSSCDAWCPKMMFAKDDILVLEDLSLRGYKTLPFRFELKKCHIEVALTTLAKLHSRSFIYEAKNPQQKVAEDFAAILTDKSFIASNPWIQNGFQAIKKAAEKVGSFRKFQIKDEVIQKLGAFFTRIYQPENDIPKVFSHSDLWKNNLMFTFDGDLEKPTHCLLLDYQLAKYVPFPIDALMLIILNTRRNNREKDFNAYLKFYYGKLTKELSNDSIDFDKIVSYEKFLSSCDYFKLVALVYNAISLMITFIPTEVYTQMTAAEYDEFMTRDRFATVSGIMDIDEVYQECVAEAVDELIEYLSSASCG